MSYGRRGEVGLRANVRVAASRLDYLAVDEDLWPDGLVNRRKQPPLVRDEAVGIAASSMQTQVSDDPHAAPTGAGGQMLQGETPCGESPGDRGAGRRGTDPGAHCTAPPDPRDVVECGSDDQERAMRGSLTQGVGVDRDKTRGAGEPSEPGTVQRDAARSPTGSSAPPGGHGLPRVTVDKLAEQAGISRRLIFYVRRVRIEAPELVEALVRGEVGVTDADAIRRRPENERRSALEAVRRREVKTLQRYFAAKFPGLADTPLPG